MATHMVCDLCQGPIEPNTIRGCIHVPKLLQTGKDQHLSFMESVMQAHQKILVIQGQQYEVEELDICEICVRMIQEMRNRHPLGKVHR